MPTVILIALIVFSVWANLFFGIRDRMEAENWYRAYRVAGFEPELPNKFQIVLKGGKP